MQFLRFRHHGSRFIAIVPVILSLCFISGIAEASSFLVTWEAPSSAPSGSLDYYVYYSTVPGDFDDEHRCFVDGSESVVIEVPGEEATAYYFAVQSVDTDSGLTSTLAAPQEPMLVAGPGPGCSSSDTARLFAFNDLAPESASFAAFDNAGDTRGLMLACGDVLGLGHDQIIAAAGPGSHGPEIRVFHADGTQADNGCFQAFAYGTAGASVCCGDIDGDGMDEIVAGVGPGRFYKPGVRVFDYCGETFSGVDGLEFLAFPKDQGYGVSVACGDLDGDGIDEIITGCGPGPALGSRVRAFRLENGSIIPFPGVDFVAYPGTDTRGVNVACGDLDGDGYDEIITGPGPALNCGAVVRTFNVDGGTALEAGPAFRAYPMPHYGVKVAAADVDGNCLEEVITAPGPSVNYPGVIRWFSVTGGRAECGGEIDAFEGTGDDCYGANLAAGRLPTI